MLTSAVSIPALPKVRASELVGRGWLNTGGRALSLAELRGKVVKHLKAALAADRE